MNHILWKYSKWYKPFPPLFIWHIWIFQSIPVFVSWHWGYDRCAQVPSISAREAPRNGVESNNAGNEKASMEKRWKTMCIVYIYNMICIYIYICRYIIYEKIQFKTMYFWLTYNYWTWTKIHDEHFFGFTIEHSPARSEHAPIPPAWGLQRKRGIGSSRPWWFHGIELRFPLQKGKKGGFKDLYSFPSRFFTL